MTFCAHFNTLACVSLNIHYNCGPTVGNYISEVRWILHPKRTVEVCRVSPCGLALMWVETALTDVFGTRLSSLHLDFKDRIVQWITTINYCLTNVVHLLTSLDGRLCCNCKASTARKGLSAVLFTLDQVQALTSLLSYAESGAQSGLHARAAFRIKAQLRSREMQKHIQCIKALK